MNLLGISIPELVVALTIFPIATALLKLHRPVQPTALIILLAVLILSVAEASQFMTVDEFVISNELLSPEKRGSGQWSQGALRTSLPISVTVVRLGEVFGANQDLIRISLKLVYWAVGALTLTLLIQYWTELVDLNQQRRILFAILAMGLFFSPIVSQPLKTVNYDLCSLLFGVLGLIIGLNAARASSASQSLLAVIVATLATQEKFSTSLILYLVLGIAIVLWYRRSGISDRFYKRILVALTPLAVSIGTILIWFVAYLLISDAKNFSPQILSVLDPLVSILWVPARFLFNENPTQIRALLTTLLLLLVVVSIGLVKIFRPLRFYHQIDDKILNRVIISARLAPIACVSFGLIGLATLQPYWAPIWPASEAVKTMTTFNKIILHFGDSSLPAHYLSLFIYNLELIFVAIPTVFWLLWIISFFLGWKMLKTAPEPIDIIKILVWVFPVAAAIFAIPVAHRYLNFSILLLVLTLLTDIVRTDFRRVGTTFSLPLAALASLTVMVEAAPFSPLGAAFRPFWLNYDDAVLPEPGRLNPSWMGWGEEIMQGGKLIESECRAERTSLPCEDLHLHAIPGGAWLRSTPTPFSIDSWWTDLRGNEPVSESDYYLFNRSNLIQGFVAVPNIAPDYRIDYRNYGMVWIWRGDRLAASGYKFTPDKE